MIVFKNCHMSTMHVSIFYFLVWRMLLINHLTLTMLDTITMNHTIKYEVLVNFNWVMFQLVVLMSPQHVYDLTMVADIFSFVW